METRRAILDAACGLCNDEGIDAVTVRRVAGASNYGRSSVTHHFPTMSNLLDAVHLMGYVAFGRVALRRPVVFFQEPNGPGPAETARRAAYRGIENDGLEPTTFLSMIEEFKQDYPGFYDLIRWRPCPPLDPDIAPINDKVVDAFFGGNKQGGSLERALDVVFHQWMSLHEYQMTLSPIEAEKLARRAPTSKYRAIVFDL